MDPGPAPLNPELLSAVAVLPPEPRTRNPFVGRGAHAAFLSLIARRDAQKAQDLHQEEGLKPFTTSSFLREKEEPGPPTSRLLRFTCLEESLARLLQEAIASGQAEYLVLDDISFPVREWCLEAAKHSWASVTTYQDLAARWLLGRSGLPRRVALEFVSPTTFHSGGHNIPLPLPGLVFGSLLEKWNAFSPIALSPDLRRFAEECLVLSKFRLETRMVQIAGGRQVGFVGWCEYTATVGDPYWLSLVNLLAEFAFFSGVGAKTTMGLGQCRRVQC